MPAKSGKRRMTVSQRCGLQFPVGRVRKFLKLRLGLRQRMSMGAPIYCSAVLEYLAAEVLEISGNVARDHKLKRITPRHVMLAIANDEELKGLCKNVMIPAAGVMPNIHPVLCRIGGKPVMGHPMYQGRGTAATQTVKKVTQTLKKKLTAPAKKGKAKAIVPTPKKGGATAKGKTAPKKKTGGVTELSEKILSGGQKLTVLSGDLVDVKCNCIVMSDGGQVNSRLTNVGGADFQQKIRDAGAEWTKTVGICEAANFNCDYVMRCSAPSWAGGNPANAISELDRVIKTCLETADKKKVSTIGFPSIGSGGAGFPKQTAVQTILRTMADYLKSQGKKTNITQVFFVLYDKQSINIYTSELGRFVE